MKIAKDLFLAADKDPSLLGRIVTEDEKMVFFIRPAVQESFNVKMTTLLNVTEGRTHSDNLNVSGNPTKIALKGIQC